MFRIKIGDSNLHKLLKHCQDLEKRGYECLMPIKKIERIYHQVTKDKDYRKKGKMSMGVTYKYVAVYEKVKSYA